MNTIYELNKRCCNIYRHALWRFKNSNATTMSSRLDKVKEWSHLAKESRYCALSLATVTGVSSRQLRRYFADKHKTTPHKWLHELCMRRAVELLCEGELVRVVAEVLRYKDVAYFTQDFTAHFGICPSKFAEQQPELNFPAKMSAFHNRCPLFTTGFSFISVFLC